MSCSAEPPVRVVSLVPSATETLSAWQLEPIACTRFCERPDLPHVGGTKDPDIGAIVELAPDLIVLCEEENRREDAEALERADLDLFVFTIDALADVDPELARLRARLGLSPRNTAPRRGVPRQKPRLRAFVPIWRKPWMTISRRTYGADLLAQLGVEVVMSESGQRYPEVTLEAVVAAGPDVVLAPSEPYPFTERQRAELEAVAPTYFVDGQDLFWWGVRTPEAVERLGAVVASIM